MAAPTISRLTDADEGLVHQFANTFASVSVSDHSWTEKIWFTLMRKDATLQIDLGIGKYTNRNIMDGFAGIARGKEQRAIRVSRILGDDDRTTVGPITYEVVRPFKEIRMSLRENDAQPIQFELTYANRMPAFFEGRDTVHDHRRKSSDVVRYHQPGTVSGWVVIDGEKIQINPDDWYGFRDHSWGTREGVGINPADVAPNNQNLFGGGFHFNWFVSQIQRPDGSFYDLAYYFREFDKPRGMEHFTGFINESDGRQIPVLSAWPELQYRRRDGMVMGGKIYVATKGEGRKIEERVFEVEAIQPDIAFRLGHAGYMPHRDFRLGVYKGENWIDGDHIADVSDPALFKANPSWSIGDRPLRIREGNNAGYADLESCAMGDWPAATIVD